MRRANPASRYSLTLLLAAAAACAPQASDVGGPLCVPPAGADSVPQVLQSTGCFAADGTPATNLLAYEVNSPLWADGAGKGRWLWLPAGEGASFDPNGNLQAPAGAAIFKEFAIDGVRLETRLLLSGGDGRWNGFSYAWDANQNTATLLPDGATATIAGHSWTYPSRADCLVCHNSLAGSVLGLRSQQVDMDLSGQARRDGTNQLALLEADHLAGPDPNTLERWPSPEGVAPLATRARSYLAANCAHCHQPGGQSGTATDFRFSTPLGAMGICNVAPKLGTYGIVDAQLVRPGDAGHSVLSARLHTTDRSERMPPLGRTLVDIEGVAVIDAWIDSLSSCN